MFGLIRFLISLLMLAAFVWFAVSVPLGKRTLWGHTQAIFATQEAKDLAEGTKEEAEKVARKVKQELHPPDMAGTHAAGTTGGATTTAGTKPAAGGTSTGTRKVKAPLAPH
jgi:hypothetical protein